MMDKYLEVLNRIVGPSKDKHFLDLCCGEMTHTRYLHFASHLGVDIVDWPNRPTDKGFIQADLRRWSGPKRHCDIALLSDGLEHFTKQEGEYLLSSMTAWAKQSIVFTPIGDYLVDNSATDPHTHKSGWTPQEFIERGWKTEAYPYWHSTLSLGAFFAWI